MALDDLKDTLYNKVRLFKEATSDVEVTIGKTEVANQEIDGIVVNLNKEEKDARRRRIKWGTKGY